MKRLRLIWTAPGLFMERLIWTALRIGLVVGLAMTILFYVLLVGEIPILGSRFLRLASGQIGLMLDLHDFLSLLLMGYWFHLVRHLRRRDSPLFPFLVFFLHSVVEPYLLLGDQGAAFIRTNRPWTFFLSYPIALSMLAAWLCVWGFGNLDVLSSRTKAQRLHPK